AGGTAYSARRAWDGSCSRRRPSTPAPAWTWARRGPSPAKDRVAAPPPPSGARRRPERPRPTRRGRWPPALVDGGGVSSCQAEAQLSELLDGGGDLVAGLEPDLLLLRVARDHAFGRAREDDVAGLEREVPGRVAHELRAAEDHVGGVRRLAHFVVDPALDLQAIGIAHLVGGDEPGADGREAVEAL